MWIVCFRTSTIRTLSRKRVLNLTLLKARVGIMAEIIGGIDDVRLLFPFITSIKRHQIALAYGVTTPCLK